MSQGSEKGFDFAEANGFEGFNKDANEAVRKWFPVKALPLTQSQIQCYQPVYC